MTSSDLLLLMEWQPAAARSGALWLFFHGGPHVPIHMAERHRANWRSRPALAPVQKC